MLSALLAAFFAASNPPPTWNVAGAPLRVWIQPGELTARRSYPVRLAVSAWNAQRLPLRFRLVTDSASAEVRITWTERFNEPMSGRTTRIDDGDGSITSAEVVLARSHPDGSSLNDEELRVLAMHELGHVLGLDHVADASSIMAAKVRVRVISPSDRARLLRLYAAQPR